MFHNDLHRLSWPTVHEIRRDCSADPIESPTERWMGHRPMISLAIQLRIVDSTHNLQMWMKHYGNSSRYTARQRFWKISIVILFIVAGWECSWKFRIRDRFIGVWYYDHCYDYSFRTCPRFCGNVSDIKVRGEAKVISIMRCTKIADLSACTKHDRMNSVLPFEFLVSDGPNSTRLQIRTILLKYSLLLLR